MKVPSAESAVIPRAKVVDYLLSETHFEGRHKASFFLRFGCSPSNWTELANLLRHHAEDHEIAREESSPFGMRLVVEGIMTMPDGRTPHVRTVWFIRTGESVPRFVTAYPIERSRLEDA